ncbi:IS481 family transposase [Corynebacterium nasicanis]|uniref:IS481 family transposase n=1 Tax=Corynebacterium nasicanis TaxID=1448267 RepID=A0ABW1Q7K8_9CORY
MTHRNASLTALGRQRIVDLVLKKGWSQRRVAERFQVSVATVNRWVQRARAGEDLTDRSSRPRTCPHRLPQRTERRIINLRFTRRWGPHRIGYHLGIPRSTVGRVLARYNMPRLACIDQTTGLPVRKQPARRYEYPHPGDMVHVDIKKLGRIPDGGGWKIHGRGSQKDRAAGRRRDAAWRAGAKPGRGYSYLHHAVDDHSRVVYSEILDDEKKETAAGFWARARAYFDSLGITVKRVMTDNGSCYRSHAFAAAIGQDVSHRFTRAYRPQTNGKVERFNRTLMTEWAYAQPYTSEKARQATYADFIHDYNCHRAHTAIGGLTPMQRVHNVTGKYS